MRTVDDFARIRLAHRDGLSIHEIARLYGCSRKTVRKALRQPEPVPYRRRQPYPAPKLGPFQTIIDTILTQDEQAPRKQRHTAAQLFRRLQAEHGYAGSYDQVRRYVQARRRHGQETFIPLAHEPGQRLEADFGHIYVDFPDGRRQVAVLVLTWSYSHYAFALAVPTERTEAILHGLVEGFRFFGCVPRELWWDNPTTLARVIGGGRQRHLQPRYVACASHYNFEPLFCLVRRANEKPDVEHKVYDLQRRWATPVPCVPDLAALNAHLRRCCEQERDRTSARQSETIGCLFECDRQSALPLPAQEFDPCVTQPAQVDKYQTVHFDHNQYSVPRAYAFQTVTVKAYVEQVAIVAQGHVVARHSRSYDHGQQVLDPLHYLVTLERRPAALDHAPVYRNWQLPASFQRLRQRLEAEHGPRAGARQFIRVLQLLAQHPLPRVEEAVRHSLGQAHVDVAWIQRRVTQWAQPTPPPPEPPTAHDPQRLRAVQVPPPDLNRFNLLLSGGEPHDQPTTVVAPDQPQAPEAADHAGRVPETGP